MRDAKLLERALKHININCGTSWSDNTAEMLPVKKPDAGGLGFCLWRYSSVVWPPPTKRCTLRRFGLYRGGPAFTGCTRARAWVCAD